MADEFCREAEYQALRRFLKTVRGGDGYRAKLLTKAIDEELTARQKEMVELYYLRQMRMVDIADELKVSVSTVSRTLKRGRARLRRCLKYGGAQLLQGSDEE